MKIIAFVPARIGSKSIPFKNIINFCGKPLIYWCLNSLNNVSAIDEIYVASDSDMINNIALSFNFDKVKIFNRSFENAQDESTTESAILEFLNKNNFTNDTIFILSQITSPFTQSDDYKTALLIYKDSKVDSLLSCVVDKKFIWDKTGKSINYNYKNRFRRQDFDGTLIENGAFYINTVGNIKKYKNRLSGKIFIYEMPEYTKYEIDELDDLFICEKIMYKYILHNTLEDIKMVITDVDGVLTDGSMYYSNNGDELKRFSTYDGKAFEILRYKGIKTAIITSEFTYIVDKRGSKIKADYIYQGVSDKLYVILELCKKENISLNNVAYIGDDLNDLELLKNVGFPACPINAINEIKKINNIIIINKKGGDGVIREFLNIMENK